MKELGVILGMRALPLLYSREAGGFTVDAPCSRGLRRDIITRLQLLGINFDLREAA